MQHTNSDQAWDEIRGTGSKERRRSAILSVFRKSLKPLRDYDVLSTLFPNSTDMNLVRPRITELTQSGLLKEVGRGKSHTGNRPVRLCQYTF